MRRLIMAGLVLLVASACGDDGGASSSSAPSSTTTPAPFVCPDPIPVGDAAALLAVIAGAEWDWAGPYSSGSRPPILEVAVTGTITVESADVPLPQECLDRSDCRDQAVFATGDRPGVEVEGDADLFEGDTNLTLADTKVRLGLTLRDTHPGPFNYVPIVTVLDACGTPCDPTEFSCPADGTCYASFESFCRRCEGNSVEECACRTPAGFVEDEEFCQYFVSGDVIEVGVCRSGVCSPE